MESGRTSTRVHSWDETTAPSANICDRPYNDIQPWKYHRLLDVFGTGMAFDVRTEGELEEALRRAALADTVVFIEVHTDRLDCFESLKRARAT